MTANHTLTWVCYNDGPLNVNTTTTISGYTTDATRFITLTVASAAQVASGVSQRHTGIEATGARMERLAGGIIAMLDVSQPFTRVEWLELDGNSVASTDGIVVNAAGTNALLQNLVIHDMSGPAPEGGGIVIVSVRSRRGCATASCMTTWGTGSTPGHGRQRVEHDLL